MAEEQDQRLNRELNELRDHRLRFREHDKEHVLRLTNRLAIAGSVVLAEAYATAAAAVAAVVYAWLWYGLALVRARAGR